MYLVINMILILTFFNGLVWFEITLNTNIIIAYGLFSGYSTIVEIPAGATDIFIKEMAENKNSIGKV
jgi:hypothetical protein